MKPLLSVAGALALAAAPVPGPSIEEALARIQAEGRDKSQVMDIAGALTDVYGPRLTGSPGARAASEYARAKLQEWGAANARLEPFPFGAGWSNERFWIRMAAPQPQPLLAYPRAWTPSTDGAVAGEAVLVAGKAPADLDRYRGTLKGKFAVVEPDPERPPEPPQPERFSEADLAALAQPLPPGTQRPARMSDEQREFNRLRDELLVPEGALAAIEPSRLVRHGNVMVARSGARLPSDPRVVPTVVMAIEHYGRIVRLLQRGVPVKLEMDSLNKTHAETQSWNVVAEIPGSDTHAEPVMIGAHLDSWHGGTGATDNAAGAAVMLEAMRILQAVRLPLRRSVRIGLWTGEEHGTLGARAYIKQHLAGDAGARPETGRSLSVYLNLDAGAGAIRGVFLQGNEQARPILARWMKPLGGLGMTTLSIRNSTPGSSDHQAFNEAGVPGFQFIQDPLDYEDRARTHHTNMDVYEALDPAALRTNAVLVAAFAYQAANSDEMPPPLPKPSPSPKPPARPGGSQPR